MRAAHRRGTTLIVMTIVLASSGHSQTVRQRLTVQRHVTIPAQWDPVVPKILSSATEVLQKPDYPNDIACDVEFALRRPVSIVAYGSGVINDFSDLILFTRMPNTVTIVQAIPWCGKALTALGCAHGGSAVIAAGWLEEQGITWTHEYGHMKGLDHREDDPHAVMYPSGGLDKLGVNDAECLAFRSTLPLPRARGLAVPPPQPQVSVREFVHRTYIHGVPYAEASRFDTSITPMLVAMLDNSEEERYWANIVTTLGMAGDARAVSPLISFLREGTRELSAENLAAKLSVPIALGLLVNRIHSLEAAEYLKASLDPRIWSRRDLGWRNPFDSSTSNRNLELTKVAVLGLGLSGDSTAETALLNLQRQPLTLDLETRAFRAEVKSVVAEALEAFRIIRDGGLSRYYGR